MARPKSTNPDDRPPPRVPGTASTVTHIVKETPLTLPTRPVQCMWNGCKCAPVAPGKPYCATHHAKSGALFA